MMWVWIACLAGNDRVDVRLIAPLFLGMGGVGIVTLVFVVALMLSARLQRRIGPMWPFC